MSGPDPRAMRVDVARWQAPGVTSYDLVPLDGDAVAAWEPGAHVDVHLPSGTVRQYSLCGEPADPGRYRIAVLEVVDGRGGSCEVHRALRPGAEVLVGAPRHDFALDGAGSVLFVAGGIGITPILPMVAAAEAAGRDWRLVYAARPGRHAFTAELVAYGPRVERVEGTLDLDGIVASAHESAVYACGPAGMLDDLAARLESAGRGDVLRTERFSAPALVATDGDTFEIELARTGTSVLVGSEETVLEAIRRAGVDHPSSCEMGICGTCEVKVLAGTVDHRDDLLTPAEQESGATMMACVSRSACPKLVLDA
ncbi:ferredoxin-NADP reductase [Mumia flava]|uniref:Ferredoxin-NADP reductase n=1 Tax=Mumia flava TaxID=1348852 RepID=A0A0B2B5J4_9ACTN|nr:PDR/VanB family oxidoreductase [Mumia flava]PJJ54325.1 ferredoxin-NADP reductase [Mumia flava]